ncbi:MAG: DUF4956 domain-containing protein [Bacteroidota bacterium]
MELINEFLLEMQFFGIKLINTQDFVELAIRFLFNSLVSIIIIRYIYYPTTKNKDYLFTYYLFGLVVFFVCILLANVKLRLGFALGLFAIFSLLRYRTDPIPIKEMTYLFIVVGISVINSLSSKKVSYVELLFTNFAIVAVTYSLERLWLQKREIRKRITYEKIELIKPENHHLLMKDLRERTGLNIHRFEIRRIDFLRDTARIWIYFYNDEKSSNIYEQDFEESFEESSED